VLGPGSATTFAWTYSLSGLGNAEFTATVTGLNSGTGSVLVSAGTAALTSRPLRGSLAVTPRAALLGAWADVVLTVTNAGNTDVTGVLPSISITSGTAFVAWRAGPVPAGPVTLPGRASQSFTWTYSASGVGVAGFSASVTGIESWSGSTVTASAAGRLGVDWMPSCPEPLELISTIAGPGGADADGILATLAVLNGPAGVAVDVSGNVYIVEIFTNRVRRVDAITGLISTIAGTGTAGYNGDGIPATTARLDSPNAVAVDAFGNVYIADFDNERIR
jgi:hypothetical protein